MTRILALFAATFVGFLGCLMAITSKSIGLAAFGAWTVFWTLVLFVPERD